MASTKHISISLVACLVGLIVVIAAVGSPFLMSFLKYDSYNKQDFIDADAYQALFLTNDQIYFGHLKNISRDYLILHDVYYVKVDDDGAGQLVKLGAIEPHGPKDVMVLNRDHVLFWENLKFDSQVVKTITNMQLKK